MSQRADEVEKSKGDDDDRGKGLVSLLQYGAVGDRPDIKVLSAFVYIRGGAGAGIERVGCL